MQTYIYFGLFTFQQLTCLFGPSASLSLLYATSILRLFGVYSLCNNQLAFFHLFTYLPLDLFYEELVSPGYLGFGGYLIINLLSPACLPAFLFYVELVSPGYLGFGIYLIIHFLSASRRRAFFFYVELAFTDYFGFGVFLIINLVSTDRLRAVFRAAIARIAPPPRPLIRWDSYYYYIQHLQTSESLASPFIRSKLPKFAKLDTVSYGKVVAKY